MTEGPLGTIPQINIDVFCVNADAAQTIQEAAGDRRMSRASVRVLMGGVDRALNEYDEENTTPDILIVEVIGDRESVLTQMDDLAEICDVNTYVLVLGRVNDVLLYRELTRRGVSDYLASPYDAYTIIRTIAEIYGGDGAKPIGRAYAFMGVRGGAGGSTIAHNVASAMSLSYDTACVIADFDLAFGTLSLNFNEDTSLNISEIVFDPTRVDNVLLERLLIPYSKKLSLLVAPGNIIRAYDMPERAADAIIDNLKVMIPVAVLDVPNGWNSWQQHTLMQSEEIVFVCTPDLASLRSAKQLLEFFRRERPNDSEPKFILNQVDMPKREPILTEEFQDGLGCELFATVPFDAESFSIAANNGKPLVETDPDTKASIAITEIAAKLLNKKLDKPQSKGISAIFSKFKKK